MHFGSVKSAMYLWINGRFVGYSEGSKLPAEFDLTAIIVPGTETTVTLAVLRFSTGSFLEDQVRRYG